MKTASLVAAAVLLWLQYVLWFGDSGHFAQARLEHQLDERTAQVTEIRQENEALTARVLALKQDRRHFEAQAREALGMIREGETLYLVPDD